jgi:hypothetical protein
MTIQAINDLVVALFQSQREYWQLRFGRDRHGELGPPATPEELGRLEGLLSSPLPPSYREFLSLHRDWSRFIGDAHLLSLDQRNSSTMATHLNALRGLAEENGDRAVADGFVIVAGEASQYVVYLDVGTRRDDGEMDVVEWSFDDGEVGRYPDFVAYLQHQLDVSRRLVAKEKRTEA